MAKIDDSIYDLGDLPSSAADDGIDFDPFAKPIKRKFKKDWMLKSREEAPRIEPVEETILKSVYCNYRGRVTVYDINGQKVHELSGMLDYEKYIEIERRSNSDITEFDGIEDYRRIAAQLKKTADMIDYSNEPEPEGEPSDDPFSQLAPQQQVFNNAAPLY